MRFLLIFCFGLIAVAGANPAAADPFDRRMGFRPYVQDQRARPEPQRGADRRSPQRDMDRRGAAADRVAPQRETRAPADADRGRMSPDERRQLRRDIEDAGKDIYRRDRPAPRREQRR